MIDASCTLWEDDCGTKGSCWVYDNAGMSLRLFILALVLKLVSILFNILALCVYKPPQKSEDLTQGEMHNLTMENMNNNGGNMLSNSASSTAQIIPPSESEVGPSTLPEVNVM